MNDFVGCFAKLCIFVIAVNYNQNRLGHYSFFVESLAVVQTKIIDSKFLIFLESLRQKSVFAKFQKLEREGGGLCAFTNSLIIPE